LAFRHKKSRSIFNSHLGHMGKELISQSEASATAGSDAIAKLAYELWLNQLCPGGSPEHRRIVESRFAKDGDRSEGRVAV
jgi:hypothetical protein